MSGGHLAACLGLMHKSATARVPVLITKTHKNKKGFLQIKELSAASGYSVLRKAGL